MRRIGTMAAVALAGIAALGARQLARRFLFPVHDVRYVAPPADVATWTLTASDGVPVHAVALIAPGDRKVVVHFHNNRETMVEPIWMARELHRRGLGVVVAEFRGYGASVGSEPCEDGLYRDAEAVLDRVKDAGYGPERVVLWGTSLGTGVASEMATRGRGAALVLVTPYTSIPDLVTDVIPGAPADWVLSDRFDTLSKCPSIGVPALVVHGTADEIVPYAMGKKVAEALPHSRFVSVESGRHGDLFVRDGKRLFDAIAAM